MEKPTGGKIDKIFEMAALDAMGFSQAVSGQVSNHKVKYEEIRDTIRAEAAKEFGRLLGQSIASKLLDLR